MPFGKRTFVLNVDAVATVCNIVPMYCSMLQGGHSSDGLYKIIVLLSVALVCEIEINCIRRWQMVRTKLYSSKKGAKATDVHIAGPLVTID
jgi:hypothetical protein